ncbi:hypothetical protein T484DRAFT_2335280 [Baffinella frigidus]|nr:hypothetical protein T484DRAFT_2335280 [Cryptophyta sp. CCMP2293]
MEQLEQERKAGNATRAGEPAAGDAAAPRPGAPKRKRSSVEAGVEVPGGTGEVPGEASGEGPGEAGEKALEEEEESESNCESSDGKGGWQGSGGVPLRFPDDDLRDGAGLDGERGAGEVTEEDMEKSQRRVLELAEQHGARFEEAASQFEALVAEADARPERDDVTDAALMDLLAQARAAHDDSSAEESASEDPSLPGPGLTTPA